MEQKRIMILGGNIVQMEATLKAKEQGYYVISSDIHPENPGHKVADEYCNVDIIDKEAVLREARRLKIDGIVPYSSDALAPIAAYVQSEMGLPGNPYESIMILTHKDRLRRFLRENGFASPWSDSFTDVSSACAYFCRMQTEHGNDITAIMKPVDSAGSRGVFKITSAEQLARNWSTSVGYSASGRVIVEQFIEKKGHQVDGDVFVVDGKIIFAGFVDQHHVKGLSEMVPVSLSFPSEHSHSILEKALAELQRLFCLLNMQTGPCNVEFMVGKNDEIYFIDLGPRNGGCKIPFLEKESVSFDEDLYTVRAAVGDSVPEWKVPLCTDCKGNYVMYCRPFTTETGTYDGLWMSDYFKGKVIDIAPLMKVGDKIEPVNNGNDTVAVVFARFDKMNEMLDMIANMQEHVKPVVR